MNESSSYRRIVRSTSVIGAATLGTIAVGLLRTKIFALLVGPQGIGIFGVLNTAMAWASAVIGLGIASSSVREIAVGIEDPEEMNERRLSAWTLTFLLAIICLSSILLLRVPLSFALNLGRAGAGLLDWVAVAAAATIIGGTQLAELQAFGRIGDLAKVRLYGAVVGSAAAIALAFQFGVLGLAIGLAAIAAVNLGTGFFYQIDLPRIEARIPAIPILLRNWRELILLGFMLMISGFAGYLAQIALRALIIRHDGLTAAGLYQAAWGLSVTNLGILLGAVVTDYYPRLAQIDRTAGAGERLVNQQLEILLLIGGPLLFGVLALAPLAMQILYSHAFIAGTELLRWHLLGDVFKLPGWCFGYVLIVRKDGRFFMFAECAMAIMNVALYLLMQDHFGVNAAGIAYFIAVSIYSIFVMLICAKRYDIAPSRANLRLLAFWAVALGILFLFASQTSALDAALLGVPVGLVAGLLNMRRLHHLLGAPSLNPRDLLRSLRGIS